jgi:site-specific DNA recombinase
MLDYVAQGGADEIVVQYLDRFGRNSREIRRRYWDLEDRGVSVIATDENIQEELPLMIKAYMAGAESRRNSERVRSYMPKAIAKGVHAARPPYGLHPVKQVHGDKVETTWELDQGEAPAVREMYRLAVEDNLGYKAIGDRLTAMGHKTKGGRPLASYTVSQILNNPAIMGTLGYGRKPRKGNPPGERVEIPGFFPPILSAEEWQRLQERLAIRRESPKGKAHSSTYLLGGIVRCGHCGGPMVGKAGSLRQGKRYRNYFCSHAMRSKALCGFYNGHSAPKLEAAILDYLGQFSDPQVVRRYLEATEVQETDRLQAELKGIEARLGELDRQFLADMERLDRGVINEAEFGRRNTARRQEVVGMESRKTELTSKLEAERGKAAQLERVPVEVKTFLEAFQGMEVRQAKAQLQTILKAAHVYRDGRIELEFRG